MVLVISPPSPPNPSPSPPHQKPLPPPPPTPTAPRDLSIPPTMQKPVPPDPEIPHPRSTTLTVLSPSPAHTWFKAGIINNPSGPLKACPAGTVVVSFGLSP